MKKFLKIVSIVIFSSASLSVADDIFPDLEEVELYDDVCSEIIYKPVPKWQQMLEDVGDFCLQGWSKIVEVKQYFIKNFRSCIGAYKAQKLLKKYR